MVECLSLRCHDIKTRADVGGPLLRGIVPVLLLVHVEQIHSGLVKVHSAFLIGLFLQMLINVTYKNYHVFTIF